MGQVVKQITTILLVLFILGVLVLAIKCYDLTKSLSLVEARSSHQLNWINEHFSTQRVHPPVHARQPRVMEHFNATHPNITPRVIEQVDTRFKSFMSILKNFVCSRQSTNPEDVKDIKNSLGNVRYNFKNLTTDPNQTGSDKFITNEKKAQGLKLLDELIETDLLSNKSKKEKICSQIIDIVTGKSVPVNEQFVNYRRPDEGLIGLQNRIFESSEGFVDDALTGDAATATNATRQKRVNKGGNKGATAGVTAGANVTATAAATATATATAGATGSVKTNLLCPAIDVSSGVTINNLIPEFNYLKDQVKDLIVTNQSYEKAFVPIPK